MKIPTAAQMFHAVITFALLTTLLAPSSSVAGDCGTAVESQLIVNETWTVSGSPYCISADTQVASLTIEKGVTVSFLGDHVLEVVGTLTAIGTEQDSIRFTRPDSVSGWQGIYFHEAGAGSELLYCLIEKSTNSGVRIVDSIPPTIEHCSFTANQGYRGGGLSIVIDALPESQLELNECVFTGNTSTNHGGALYINMVDGKIIVVDSQFAHNTANPLLAVGDIVGGGIYHAQGDATITGCSFVGNRSNARCTGTFGCNVLARGGAIYFGSPGTVDVTNSSFFLNRTHASYGSNCFFGGSSRSYGGGVYVQQGVVFLTNVIFATNSCTATDCGRSVGGGGLAVNGGTVTVTNNTIVENADATGVRRSGGSLDIISSILYLNNGEGTQVGGDCTISYSDIQGGFPGDGNIQQNPIYDADYRIVSGSPCIDSGSSTPCYNDLCQPPALGTFRNDMGAHGGPGACGWPDTAEDPLPASPCLFSAEVEIGTVNLFWSASSSDDVVEYRLYRDIAASPTTLLASIPAGSESYADAGIVPETFYHYRVTAVDAAGQESAYTAEVIAKADDVTPPAAPADLAAEAGDGFVALTWTANGEPDAIQYRIYRDTHAEPLSQIDSVAVGDEGLVDSSVQNGTIYYYRLTAMDDGGNESDFSAEVSAMPDIPRADIAITMEVAPEIPGRGDAITLTVRTTNSGPKAATNVTILDNLPEGLLFVSADPLGVYNAETGIWTVGDVGVDSVAALTIEARLDSFGVFTNIATVSSVDQPDPVESNNTASVEIRTREADLSLAVSVSLPVSGLNAIVGEEAVYSVVLANNGPSDASAIVLRDVLPGAVSFVGSSASHGNYDHQDGDWTVGNLDSGVDATLSITTTVTDTGSIVYQTWITDTDSPDPVAGNDSSSVTMNCNWADLVLTVTAADTIAVPGDRTTIEVELRNDGPFDAGSIQVQNQVPLGMTFGSVTPTMGSFDGGSSVWALDTLSVGSTARLTISAVVDSAWAIVNTASVIASSRRDSNADDDSGSIRIDALPNRPPEIEHSPLSVAWTAGRNTQVTAMITGDSEVSGATLYYRAGRDIGFTEVPMEALQRPLYRATVPGLAITSHGIEYYMSAVDDEAESLATGLFFPSVDVSNLIRSEVQPGGGEQTAYRMISMPLNLTSNGPNAVLSDDLGSYHTSEWRLFGLDAEGNYDEHPNAGDFEPGKAFWLIVREPERTLESGPGASVSLDGEFGISLAPGWTLIGNPFTFDVPQQSLRLSSGKQLDIRKYHGLWSRHTEALTPFEGYALYSNEDDLLLIDPEVVPPGPMVNRVAVEQPKLDWSVRIKASVQQARDEDNFAAVADEATEGLDRLDLAEPPPIGGYVSVYFPHPEWDGPTSRFTVDARSEPENGATWDFEIRTNISDRVELRFEGLDEVPAEFDVLLVDPSLGATIDLRTRSGHEFMATDDQRPRQFKLIIGNEEYFDSVPGVPDAVPFRLELGHNVPNPFASLTSIRYALPSQRRVTLEIYSVLGERIATLVDDIKPAGHHVITWDGRDQSGRAASPGVYFYSLMADGAAPHQRRKMILVR